MTPTDRVGKNVESVRERIADAARRAGRSADEVRLVAVTKNVSTKIAAQLAAAGCADLGESRPQALWEKAEALPLLPVRWHLIGHLQRNKVARTLPLSTLIHSVDSRRLLEEIDRQAGVQRLVADVLLEINISGDANKHGVPPAEAAALVDAAAQLGAVRLRGLMTMAALEGSAGGARRDFARLRALRDALSPNLPERVSLSELSMGMSGDFEEAIAEGATIVRIGSALFQGIA